MEINSLFRPTPAYAHRPLSSEAGGPVLCTIWTLLRTSRRHLDHGITLAFLSGPPSHARTACLDVRMFDIMRVSIAYP